MATKTTTTKTAKTTRTKKDDGRIQIVGRLPKDLSEAVRATAKRLDITLNAFMVDAFTTAVNAAKTKTAPKKKTASA